MCAVCKVPHSVSLILKAATLDATVIYLCFIDEVERHRNQQHAQSLTVSKGKLELTYAFSDLTPYL